MSDLGQKLLKFSEKIKMRQKIRGGGKKVGEEYEKYSYVVKTSFTIETWHSVRIFLPIGFNGLGGGGRFSPLFPLLAFISFQRSWQLGLLLDIVYHLKTKI